MEDTSSKTAVRGRLLLGLLVAIMFAAPTARGEESLRDWRKLANKMVDDEIVAAGVTNERVVRAMRDTPRHEFVIPNERERAYLDMALPIGSGQVEAQCKTLVGARCKQAGMRNWTYQGAEAILRLRAARQDGSFEALWNQKLRLAA